MKKLIIAVIILLALPSIGNANECSENFTLKALQTLKKDKFEIQSAQKRNATAVQLLGCLGHQDPAIRDGVVYEGLSHWLRNELLDPSTVKTLFDSLVSLLNQTNKDADNFTQPFAALVFSEVVRVDRISPYLSNNERQKAVDISTRYMRNIKDYRGFDDTSGWRHAVAHTSDVFLQLALNKNISKAQLDQLLSAIKVQVSPHKLHFYSYGEPKRLAMAFIYIVLRGEHTELQISNYLAGVANPAPFVNWNGVYSSQNGLAKLHNTRSFIYSLVAITGQSKNPNLQALQPILAGVIKQLG